MSVTLYRSLTVPSVRFALSSLLPCLSSKYGVFSSMVCIHCGHKLQVANSRPQRKTNSVWRRRSCPECLAVFTSIEKLDLHKSIRIRYNPKHLEPFWRDILFSSVYEACKHRKSPVRDATELTDTIIAKMLRKKYGSIATRNQLCAITTEVLKRFDKATASSYIAYHPIKD